GPAARRARTPQTPIPTMKRSAPANAAIGKRLGGSAATALCASPRRAAALGADGGCDPAESIARGSSAGGGSSARPAPRTGGGARRGGGSAGGPRPSLRHHPVLRRWQRLEVVGREPRSVGQEREKRGQHRVDARVALLRPPLERAVDDRGDVGLDPRREVLDRR